MDLDACKKMNENQQSEHMNDAALATAKNQYSDVTWKITSRD